LVTVHLFAILREKAGVSQVEVSLDGPTSVTDLLAKIGEVIPAVSALLTSMEPRVAINQEFAHADDMVNESDEVAIIPPVSGGTGHPDEMVIIQEDDFSVDEAIAKVMASSTAIGGVNVFLGTARDISKGHEVDFLEFEHYPGMAEAKLKEIRERSLKDYDILETLIIHRYGRIQIGENIVLIICGAQHRDQAFEASRFCIDELKQITPIWKKEVTPSGDFWIEEHP